MSRIDCQHDDVSRLLENDSPGTTDSGVKSGSSDPERPPAVGAVLAAGWVALAGSLGSAGLAVVGWFTANDGTTQQAVRVGVDGWLLAHRVPVELDDGTFSLAPLGVTLVLLFLLARGGGWVGRSCAVHTTRDVAVGAGMLALVYGGFAALIAALARTEGDGPQPLVAFVSAAVLALLVAGPGVLRTSGVADGVGARLPVDIRAGLYGGLVGLGGLLLSGLLLVVVALVLRAGQVGELGASLRPGAVGVVLLVLLCLAYLPNAAVCAAAYALGPGFALGTGTVVAPTGVVLGPLPAFPLLGAVPIDESPSALLMVVVVLPLAAGVLAGMAATRRYELGQGIESAVLRGVLTGVVGGFGFAVCSVLADGSGGPGRMAWFGPEPIGVGLIAMLTLTVAATVAVVVPVLWRLWKASAPPRPAEPEPKPEPKPEPGPESKPESGQEPESKDGESEASAGSS